MLSRAFLSLRAEVGGLPTSQDTLVKIQFRFNDEKEIKIFSK